MVTDTFRPFRVLMKLEAPLILAEFTPSLDGVLYSVLESRHPNLNHETLIQKLGEILKRHSSGVYHASTLIFGVEPERSLTMATNVRADSMQLRKLDSEYYTPINEKKGTYPRLNLTGGPMKNRFTVRKAYSAPAVIFEGCGDIDAIETLFDIYLFGVGYDADNAGAGAVSDCTFLELESDTSLVTTDNKPNRYLPASSFEGLVTQYHALSNRVVPPYYCGSLVPVLAPDRVRIMPLQQAKITNLAI